MGKASLPYYYLTFVVQPASSGVAQSPESLDINSGRTLLRAGPLDKGARPPLDSC